MAHIIFYIERKEAWGELGQVDNADPKWRTFLIILFAFGWLWKNFKCLNALNVQNFDLCKCHMPPTANFQLPAPSSQPPYACRMPPATRHLTLKCPQLIFIFNAVHFSGSSRGWFPSRCCRRQVCHNKHTSKQKLKMKSKLVLKRERLWYTLLQCRLPGCYKSKGIFL